MDCAASRAIIRVVQDAAQYAFVATLLRQGCFSEGPALAVRAAAAGRFKSGGTFMTDRNAWLNPTAARRGRLPKRMCLVAELEDR
jgi:hypothetical protein